MIKDLKTLKKFFREKVNTPIFGVGVYAFNRLGPEDFIPQYQLLALYDSLDTQLIEKDVPVFSLEREMGEKVRWQTRRNSTSVISHPQTKQYLTKYSSPLLLPYKSSSEMISACRENNWQLAANPPDLGKRSIDNKVKFRRILEKIGVSCPPGEIVTFGQLDFGSLAQKYNLPFVIQYPLSGGGKGTFFIKTARDLEEARESLIALTKDEINDNQEMVVSQFIKGPSPSITGCVTRSGILSTSPQHQILSMPELYNRPQGAGLFCGHDWSFSRFSPRVCRQAYTATEKVGQYLRKIGYKGVFGLDFIMDEQTEKIYVVECNPRLLGSFPTVTMAQVENGEPPILAFHILEFLNINYQVDIRMINQQIRRQRKGAQMLLHNLANDWTQTYHIVKPGVYRLSNSQEITFVRDGYKLSHLQEREEFLVTEGILGKGAYFAPSRRISRILTLESVLADYQHLNPWAKKIIVHTTRGFDLRPVFLWQFRKLFNPRLRD